VKKASYRKVNRYQVDNATAHIIRRTSEQAMNEVLQEIREATPALVYAVT
jgi:ferredoxin-like protein FixX